MQILRDNSLNDDGTDTVAGVDWFKFRETVATNFYVSGNTWIGIGQNSEQLKISRRDARLIWDAPLIFIKGKRPVSCAAGA